MTVLTVPPLDGRPIREGHRCVTRDDEVWVMAMERTRVNRSFLTAAAIGNFVEWYDFVIYTFLATQISHNFFPKSSPAAGLLSTLAVLGAGFIFRPIGGAICGHLGDRFGRRNTLAGIVLSMSVATFLMGLIPPYNAIGAWAPILLLALRLIQSFSSGGEFGSAISFTFEHADKNRRGLTGSVMTATMQAAVATSVGISLGVTSVMSQDSLESWGWRVLFLAALPIGVVGLFIRLRVKETPEFTAAREKVATRDVSGFGRNPLRDVVTNYWRSIVIGTLACAAWTAGGYVTLLYLPTYYGSILNRPSHEGFLVAFVGLVAYVVCIPIAGRISDSFTRWKVMMTGAIGIALVAIPAFLLLAHGSMLTALAVAVVFAILFSLISGPTPAFLSELVPTEVRNSSNSISYALANTLFAGFAPYVVTWMIFRTGVAIAPSFYLIGAQILTMAGLFSYALLRGTKSMKPMALSAPIPVEE